MLRECAIRHKLLLEIIRGLGTSTCVGLLSLLRYSQDCWSSYTTETWSSQNHYMLRIGQSPSNVQDKQLLLRPKPKFRLLFDAKGKTWGANGGSLLLLLQ